MGSTVKLLTILGVATAGLLYASFGTLSPCGMLRENFRQQDGLAAVLPDAIVDTALAAKYGSLGPGQCMGLLLNKQGGQVAAQTVVAGVQNPQSSPPSEFALALQQANSVMGECRDRRLNGVLKSHMESAQCSNLRVVQAFSTAKYRHMDLVEFLVAKRLEMARKLDQGQITEQQARTESQNVMAQIAEIERSRDSRRN